MTGGARFWNEETQRWEDADSARPTAPPTPPPPAMPDQPPAWPPAGQRAGAPVAGPAGAPSGPSAGEDASAPPTPEATPAGPGRPAPAVPDVTPTGSGGPTGAVSDATPSGAGASAAPAPEAAPPVPSSVEWWRGSDAGTNSGAGVGTSVDGYGPGAPHGGSGGWSTPEWPVPGVGGPVEPGQAPAPAGGFSRRTVWSVLAGAAVVGVAVSLVLTLVVKNGDGNSPKRASGSPSASVSAPASTVSESPTPSDEPTESPSASVSASPSELPAGYESYEDAEGFRIARPKGWSRSSVQSSYGIAVVSYRSPDRQHRLQVYQVAESSPDASFEQYLSDATPKPDGFQELNLENLDQGDFVGSRLEYLAGSIKGEPDVGTWHVYDERFVAGDGNIYAIAAYGPDSDGGDDELALLNNALGWFCPPGQSCDSPTDTE